VTHGALGQNMVGGIKLALDEYNKAHADCTVDLKVLRLAGQTPTRPPRWRPRSWATTPSSASSVRVLG
jgi:hypothetical protein